MKVIPYLEIWVKVFEDRLSKICEGQPLKKLNWFLKAVFHKFYLVHSWIIWSICHVVLDILKILTYSKSWRMSLYMSVLNNILMHVGRRAIWYRLYNLKIEHATLLKFTPPSVLFTFLKFYKWYQIAQHITYKSLFCLYLFFVADNVAD